MPAVKPEAKVLVTGANGYIAAWIVMSLLQKGYSVRGTVRSDEKGVYMKKQFASYGNKLEVLTVADITETGAFDNAVQGVDAIVHTAFNLNVLGPGESIDPAVTGATGILESALKHSGTQLQRIVVLSSVGAISDGSEQGMLDENIWNEGSIKEIKEKGGDADPNAKYRASKALAERASWDFVERNKSEIKWDLVTIIPPFVFGPIIREISSPETPGTAGMFYQFLVKGIDPPELILTESWVDVRDVAVAHVSAIEIEEAGGQRFIVNKGPVEFQKFVDAWKEFIAVNPSYAVASDGSKLGPGKAAPVKRMHEYNNAKSTDVLRMMYRGEKETLVDSVTDFKMKSWI